MLGIPDFWIAGAFMLCIISTLACVVYGIVNWNRGAENEDAELSEELAWEKKETEIEKNM